MIEHLQPVEIADMFAKAADLLQSNGTLIITTPNYFSAWPLIEVALNRLSEVSYEEQHITRFTFFNFVSKLTAIWPAFAEVFELQFLTSSHFGAPFLASISLDWSNRLSARVDHRRWIFPFGNLLLLSLRRRPRAGDR